MANKERYKQPVPPDAVRVWRGIKAMGTSNAEFRDKIGHIFIPTAVQTQAPLGMTAYLPTVLPASKPKKVPDEIALVFYESQATYTRTSVTTSGRAYSLLHGALFSLAASKSGFPVKLGRNLAADTPYFLFPNAADWSGGQCRLLVGTPRSNHPPAKLRRSAYRVLKTLQRRRPKGLDGGIVVASNSYFLYWEHWRDRIGKGAVEVLARMLKPVIIVKPRAATVATNGFASYAGLTIGKNGAALNLQFDRHALRLR